MSSPTDTTDRINLKIPGHGNKLLTEEPAEICGLLAGLRKEQLLHPSLQSSCEDCCV